MEKEAHEKVETQEKEDETKGSLNKFLEGPMSFLSLSSFVTFGSSN